MEQYDNLVSEYNRECDRNRSLVNQYNSIVRQIDAEIRRYNILQQDVGECQSDVARSNSYVGSLSSTVVPPLAQKGERLTRTGHKLGYSGGKEKSCIDILDELSDSYNKLKNQSYATKEMTDLVMQYFSRYGEYNKVRNYALGYVIGVDANIWRSDTPKKVISKAYLSNSDYWLSSAMMAIVHWIDNEKEAADRAIKQALDKDPKKTALFFMLVNLRFELHDAARAWYRLFMELIDENNIPDEFQYILQALLCGCFGKDSEFEHECLVKIQSLIDSAFKRNPNIGDQLVKHVSNHYHSIVNQTRNQYTMMGRAIPNYSEMLSLLSEAEKNSIILERYKFANDSTIKKKSLAFSIEDTLYSLISAYDDEEKAHLDKIKYSDAVMKAKGNIEVAEKMLKQQRELEKQNQNIAYYLVNIAVSTDQNISMVVRKFALKIVGKYCRDGALMFANGYRSKYKEEYGYTFDLLATATVGSKLLIFLTASSSLSIAMTSMLLPTSSSTTEVPN